MARIHSLHDNPMHEVTLALAVAALAAAGSDEREEAEAWVWSICVGWHCESVLGDVAKRHGWSGVDIERLKDMRARWLECQELLRVEDACADGDEHVEGAECVTAAGGSVEVEDWGKRGRHTEAGAAQRLPAAAFGLGDDGDTLGYWAGPHGVVEGSGAPVAVGEAARRLDELTGNGMQVDKPPKQPWGAVVDHLGPAHVCSDCDGNQAGVAQRQAEIAAVLHDARRRGVAQGVVDEGAPGLAAGSVVPIDAKPSAWVVAYDQAYGEGADGETLWTPARKLFGDEWSAKQELRSLYRDVGGVRRVVMYPLFERVYYAAGEHAPSPEAEAAAAAKVDKLIQDCQTARAKAEAAEAESLEECLGNVSFVLPMPKPPPVDDEPTEEWTAIPDSRIDWTNDPGTAGVGRVIRVVYISTKQRMLHHAFVGLSIVFAVRPSRTRQQINDDATSLQKRMLDIEKGVAKPWE